MALFKKMDSVKLNVEGMHCEKCVARVKDALEAVDGVAKAQVSLEENSAQVQGSASAEALVAAVEGVGFSASVA